MIKRRFLNASLYINLEICPLICLGYDPADSETYLPLRGFEQRKRAYTHTIQSVKDRVKYVLISGLVSPMFYY